MPRKELNQMFNAQPSFTLSILFTDISHYNARVIHWEAHKNNHCKADQWIAYHMTGFEYINDRLHLIFQCKAFDEDAGVTNDDDVPLRYSLSQGWHSCNYTEE